MLGISSGKLRMDNECSEYDKFAGIIIFPSPKVNLIFLCNIIRVLVTKLRATHSNEPSQYRKAVRATLVLVPLFGLHFFLIIYRPPQSSRCDFLQAYTYFSHAMDGLQVGRGSSLIDIKKQ
ncbi:calcitonin gene-related peptide type 1 receptor [Trichonephila inaurata madagascariensis]|uniref:Calcitonin gene-related peptide type 1 receptor n=1 Tax=Trichonephila inaurata madagascariensis TaxID=2747483 RepID=A0A8X6YA27_9ARAC|nr:calcitonin gene-related peptide type 1 receptor [Trichonephila inaurata madagascariensis]